MFTGLYMLTYWMNRYESLSHNKITGDFNFVVMKNFLSYENDLKWTENFIMRNYFVFKAIGVSEQAGYGLDTSNVTIENVPLILNRPHEIHLEREMITI